MAAGAWLAAAPPAAAQQNASRPPPATAPDEADYPLLRVQQLPTLRNRYEMEQQIRQQYPAAMRDSRVTGDVLLKFRLSRDGTVDSTSLSVVQASNVAFAELAATIGRRLLFTPARVDGRAVSVWTTFPIHFEIPEIPATGGSPPDEGTYELSAVDTQPELQNVGEIRRQIALLYPPAMRDLGIPGAVVLRFRILADGNVDSASIAVDEASDGKFGNAALAVAWQMRFSPARVSGRPVNVWVTLPIYFWIEGASATPTPGAGSAP